MRENVETGDKSIHVRDDYKLSFFLVNQSKSRRHLLCYFMIHSGSGRLGSINNRPEFSTAGQPTVNTLLFSIKTLFHFFSKWGNSENDCGLWLVKTWLYLFSNKQSSDMCLYPTADKKGLIKDIWSLRHFRYLLWRCGRKWSMPG